MKTRETQEASHHDRAVAAGQFAHGEQDLPPSEAFSAQANATADFYAEADADREAFWAKQAERLHWETKWSQVLDWTNAPVAKWFVGGKLNVAYNCVDRHVDSGHGDQVAIHWVGEPGDSRDITYAQLKDDVSRAANALESLGLKAGDRVAIQMPMVPEAIVAMLACARIGVLHSVVFGGFPRQRCVRAWTTRRRGSSSPPTASTAAARPPR